MVFVANSSQQQIGGGWSFISNFKLALHDKVTEDYDNAKVYFIASPTMVQREEVAQAKRDGKKIILRIDNAVRNSRNRNTGMTRMKDFAQAADAVIYQSSWARGYLLPFLDVSGEVIHNSADESIFHGPNVSKPMTFVYSRYNRDETKNVEQARYYFSRIFERDSSAHLNIIGQYSPELVNGNFDFYAGEKFDFFGVQTPDVVAEILRRSRTLIAPFFNDACSNTIIEALLCGCEVFDEPMTKTGGTPEILSAFKNQGPDYFHLARMGAQYWEVIEDVLSE